MNSSQATNLQSTALSLFQTSTGIFWSFLSIGFLLAILLIYVRGEISGAKFEDLLRRLCIAIALLIAFPEISNALIGMENHLVSAFGGDQSLKDIFSHVASRAHDIRTAGSSSWLKLGEFGLGLISTISFLILAIVKRFLDILHLTIWNLLHIFGPIALLGLLFPSSSQIPKGIFLGMFELCLWKPVWVLMGRLLIAAGFGEIPQDPSQWFDTAVTNFALAALIAQTPKIVHGLLSGTLTSSTAGALQSMVGGLGATLAGAPMSAINKVYGAGKKVTGKAASAAWQHTAVAGYRRMYPSPPKRLPEHRPTDPKSRATATPGREVRRGSAPSKAPTKSEPKK